MLDNWNIDSNVRTEQIKTSANTGFASGGRSANLELCASNEL